MQLTQNQFQGDLAKMPITFYPGTTYFATDTDTLYGYNKESMPVELCKTSTSLAYISKTRAEIEVLISTNTLSEGTLYKITGVHPTLYNDGTNSGTTVYLQALTTNTLSKEGHGEFYNPKYNQAVSGFGIFQDYNTFDFNPATLVGAFNHKEVITSDNGASGILVGHLEAGFFRSISGDWSLATSITGNISGATVDIYNINLVTYNIGDNVIWGGYHWSNTTGVVGNSINVLNLDANWSKVQYSEIDYNKVIDIIRYDYENDIVIYRNNGNGYIVSTSKLNMNNWENNYGLIGTPINISQFGNDFSSNIGVGNIIVEDGYNSNINFTGSHQYNLKFCQDSYQHDMTFGQGSSQSNLVFGQSSSQESMTFGQGSGQFYMTFDQNSYQYIITLGKNSSQYALVFNKVSYQSNVILLTNLTMDSVEFETKVAINNVDYSSATLVFTNHSKTIYSRPDGTPKIRYYDNTDTLVIANITD